MSALLKVAELKAMRVVVTDVVLEESVQQRLAAAEAASTGLRAALAKAAKVFKDEDLGFYIPDPANAAAGWRTELAQTFEVWPTDGEDAREALFREAARRAPARATDNGSAVGSRDASIWLSVVRIAGDSAVNDVIFVSSNTKDFAGSDAGIRPELASDIEADRSIRLATSPATAIEMLAEKVDTEPVDDATISALRVNFPLLDQAIREFAVTLLPGDWGEVASESSIEIHGAVERRSYKVEDARLSNVRVDLTCEMYPPAPAKIPRVTLGLWVYVWIQLSDSGMTVEIENVRERGES